MANQEKIPSRRNAVLAIVALSFAAACAAGAGVAERKSNKAEADLAALQAEISALQTDVGALKKIYETPDGLAFYAGCGEFGNAIELHSGILDSYRESCKSNARLVCDTPELADMCESTTERCESGIEDLEAQLAREQSSFAENCSESS